MACHLADIVLVHIREVLHIHIVRVRTAHIRADHVRDPIVQTRIVREIMIRMIPMILMIEIIHQADYSLKVQERYSAHI